MVYFMNVAEMCQKWARKNILLTLDDLGMKCLHVAVVMRNLCTLTFIKFNTF